MDNDPKTPPYSTADTSSFAYVSARDRWPIIVTGCIDDVHRATGRITDEEARAEGKRIVEELAKLKYELQHDRVLTPIVEDGQPDIAYYNKELAHLGMSTTWFKIPWLYAECYLYRRINTLFSLSKHWKSYDVFGRQKLSTFKSSRPAVVELAAKYKELVSDLHDKSAKKKDPDHAAESLLFREMCEICLWGNATDLSLLTSLTYEDIQKLQGSDARKASEKNIIVNDIPAAYEVLRAARDAGTQAERRVDIVLDNAGFELFVDLILAGYLLATGLATTIVLHPKSIPWFVSDVLPGDFASLLSALADPQSFYTTRDEDDAGKGASAPAALSTKEEEDIKYLFAHWSGAHAEGQLIIRPNRFWTQGGSFWRLPSQAPELYHDLCQSEVVIFKGDLNYRKLTADAMWPATTPFPIALGPLGKPKSGIRTLALRTCKADVVVGLPEGEDERLLATEGGEHPSSRARRWAWSGKWAVVQFVDGKAETVGR